MGTPLATFTNGTAMSATDVNAALLASRNYINSGIVTADFEAAGLRLEQFYRPDYYAVPRPWFDGEFAQVLDARGGQAPGELPLSLHTAGTSEARGRGFGEVRDRYSIFPAFSLLPGGWAPIEDLDRRLYVEVASRIRITAGWFAHCVVNTVTPPIVGGFFDLRYRRVEDGLDAVPTVITGTRRQVLFPSYGPYFSVIGDINVSAANVGTYDIGVCFADASVGANAWQVSLVHRNIVVEVHKRG
jgi:hypothetical protein